MYILLLLGLISLHTNVVVQGRLQNNEPMKGGIAPICPSLDKSSTACCYLHCEQCFTQCTTLEPDSDRQEDSDCAGRKTICNQECVVESTAPRNWGTHTCWEQRRIWIEFFFWWNIKGRLPGLGFGGKYLLYFHKNTLLYRLKNVLYYM